MRPRGVKNLYNRSSRWHETLARLGVGLVFIGSLAVVGWLSSRLFTEQRRAKQLGASIERINRDIESLTARLDPRAATNLLKDLNLERDAFSLSPENITNWIGRVQSDALPLVMDVEGSALPQIDMPSMGEGVAVVPLTLSITPVAGIEAIGSGYQRLLQFCRTLSTHSNRVDLIELTAQGGTNSVEHATAVVHLWSAKPAELPR